MNFLKGLIRDARRVIWPKEGRQDTGVRQPPTESPWRREAQVALEDEAGEGGRNRAGMLDLYSK